MMLELPVELNSGEEGEEEVEDEGEEGEGDTEALVKFNLNSLFNFFTFLVSSCP